MHSDLEIMGDLGELRKQARQYLIDAQNTSDQSLREELLKLCGLVADGCAVNPNRVE